MSREWKPGTIAMIGAPDGEVLAFRQERQWATLHHLYFSDWQIATVRPLVVIDPEDREQVERLLKVQQDIEADAHPTLRPADCGSGSCWIDTMQSALREFASPTPPRPDEPMGLGAVVEDAAGFLWTSVTNRGADDRWQPNHLRSDRERREWSDIAAVRVLSEGVSDA